MYLDFHTHFNSADPDLVRAFIKNCERLSCRAVTFGGPRYGGHWCAVPNEEVFRICRENWFCIKRNGDLILRIPLLAAVILLFFTWRVSVPVMLVALLFNFRYSVEGKDELKEVNAFMESAGAAARNLKEGFQNARDNNKEKEDSDRGTEDERKDPDC